MIKERRRSSVIAERAEGRERKPSVVESIAHKVRTLSTGSSPVIEENEEEEEEEERKEEKGVGRMVGKSIVCMCEREIERERDRSQMDKDAPELRHFDGRSAVKVLTNLRE